MRRIRNLFIFFYKFLVTNFFYLIYGKITSVSESINNKNVKIKKIVIQNNIYKIFFCKNCRLYTDTIHDTAIIHNNQIINGPSFQYRKNSPNDPGLANASCYKNSVLKKGTPRFHKKIYGSIFSLLIGGAGNFNYWHWLFDVLPKLNFLIKSKINENDINFFLFPNLSQGFQNETLNLLNIPNSKRLSSRELRHIFADQIIISSHPYNILNNPRIDSLNIPLWIQDFLRQIFLATSIRKTKMTSFPQKIFINRKDAKSLRYIINNESVENTLISKGFSSITLSDYSFVDQVSLFFNAKEIVGLHGAGFANLIFCRTGTRILELKPESAGDIIKNLAIQNNLIYDDISVLPESINFKNQSGDIRIDLKDLDKKLLY